MPYAMRFPRPDLMKPPESQKAMAISHLNKKIQVYLCVILAAYKCKDGTIPTYGISLENALKACAKVRVLVSMVAASPIIATAPSGSGLVIIPTIVPRKIASRCQAAAETPSGDGMNHTAAARPTDMPKFFISAPHLNSGLADGADAAPTVG